MAYSIAISNPLMTTMTLIADSFRVYVSDTSGKLQRFAESEVGFNGNKVYTFSNEIQLDLFRFHENLGPRSGGISQGCFPLFKLPARCLADRAN